VSTKSGDGNLNSEGCTHAHDADIRSDGDPLRKSGECAGDASPCGEPETCRHGRAANERTFLAWVRTGIAVIAFGFVIEKFNLFVLVMASSASVDAAHRLELQRLSGPLGRYDGLALIFGGLVLIVVATARFVRTGVLLDDSEAYSASSVRTELILSAVLVLIVVGSTAYLVFG
jgi:putative membrane protein